MAEREYAEDMYGNEDIEAEKTDWDENDDAYFLYFKAGTVVFQRIIRMFTQWKKIYWKTDRVRRLYPGRGLSTCL